MATLTFTHSTFGNGVTVDFDVNDANWRMSKIRCINNSADIAKAFVYESGILVFTATAPAFQTTSWNTTGIQLGWNDIDGGIMMGNYVLQIQCPGES